MDLLSKINQRIHEDTTPAKHGHGSLPTGAVQARIPLQVNKYIQLWWSLEMGSPNFGIAYRAPEQVGHEKQLEKLVDGLAYELKHFPQNPADRQAWQDRLRPGVMDFARTAFNLEQRHLDFIEASGMLEASQTFARQAREFDPHISADDIYQAARNVMTANFMQLLLGLPVEVTPAIFAYSMLYPYTDNYLDDPKVSPTTKLTFNHRFQRRLCGETVRPANDHEAAINTLVGMIESQWDREHFPQVYESLLAIHSAQARSLNLVAPGASPYELDVLGVSFEKGGTSVLADGYLVAGSLTPAQADMMFGYGAFTQLMDDMEDIQADMREGRLTLFSQTAGRWPLDGVTNRLFHFGQAIFSDLSAFQSQAASVLQEIMERSINPVLIDIAAQTEKYYSRAYLRELEQHVPFRLAVLNRQRQKLARQKINAGRLMEILL